MFPRLSFEKKKKEKKEKKLMNLGIYCRDEI